MYPSPWLTVKWHSHRVILGRHEVRPPSNSRLSLQPWLSESHAIIHSAPSMLWPTDPGLGTKVELGLRGGKELPKEANHLLLHSRQRLGYSYIQTRSKNTWFSKGNAVSVLIPNGTGRHLGSIATSHPPTIPHSPVSLSMCLRRLPFPCVPTLLLLFFSRIWFLCLKRLPPKKRKKDVYNSHWERKKKKKKKELSFPFHCNVLCWPVSNLLKKYSH